MSWSQRIGGLLFAAIIGIVIGVVLFNTSKSDTVHTPEDIAGQWQCTISDSNLGETMLTNAGFTDARLDCVQDKSFRYVVLAEFTADGTYTFSFDHDATAGNVTDFFTAAFADLYEARATFAPETTEMSETEFQEYLAQVNEKDDFATYFAEVSSYTASGVESYDSGDFSFKSGDTAKFGRNSANYSLADDILTLEFSDVTMVLNRVN